MRRTVIWGLVCVLLPAVMLTLGARVEAVPTGKGPWDITLNPETGRAYTANFDAGKSSVTAIDLATNTRIATIPFPPSESVGRVAVNPVTRRVYVSRWSFPDSSVQIIDEESLQVVGSLPLTGPGRIRVNPATNRIYVVNNQRDLVVIDGSTDTVLTTIPLGLLLWDVAVNPMTNRIYAMSDDRDYIWVIDGATDKVLTTVPVGPLAHYGIAVNPETNRIYVTSNGTNTVAVVDGATNTWIATIPVRNTPDDVAVNPTSNRIYVNYGSRRDDISIFDGVTHAPLATLYGGEYLGAMAVNPETNRIYVVNQSSDNVSVLSEHELLTHPSFDRDRNGDGRPDDWSGRNLQVGDSLVSDPLYEGRWAFQITGAAGVTKELRQRIVTSKPAGTILTLEGFSRSDGTSAAGGNYEVRAEVGYTDGSGQVLRLRFPKSTHGWKGRGESLVAAKPVSEIQVRVIYADQVGTAWFDALHLEAR